MADRIYLPINYSPQQTIRTVERLARAGIQPTGVQIYPSVKAFAESLGVGDRVVVSSFGVFESVVELVAALRLFYSVGASVYSLRQPELSCKLTPELVDELYRAGIEGLALPSAFSRPPINPRTLTRIEEVDRLVRTQNVSLSEACRRTGCTRNLYYYYKRQNTPHWSSR